MHFPRIAVALALVPPLTGTVACDSDGPRDPAACGDVRATPKVYYGSESPSFAPLRPGQIQAIGAWAEAFQSSVYCSGTLITPRHVLTAVHCSVDAGDRFCIGDRAAEGTCIDAREVFDAPRLEIGGALVDLDLTVVELAEDATAVVPGVEPIPIAITALTGLEGERVETAGYGQTELNRIGTRLFALERVDAVGPSDDENGPSLLRVDGFGARGVCIGDSGGPALIIDGAGAVRVAGALSYGDQSCVDQDRYTRVDVALSWIETITGATPEPPTPPCGPITATGTCSGNRAIVCDGDRLVATACDNVCGWDLASEGYRCLDGTDPCLGQDTVGSCAGDVARWCERGVPKSSDCGCLDQECAVHPAVGATCRDVH